MLSANHRKTNKMNRCVGGSHKKYEEIEKFALSP